MQIHKNEVTTGILVLVTGAILLGALVFLGMPGVVKPLNTYRIYYDNAGGIRPGAPVLLAGREIGKVTALESPVPVEKRPAGHPNYEVFIEVQVDRKAQIYRKVVVQLTQQSLMGQPIIDFVKGDVTSGPAEDEMEFVGERVPGLSESVADNIKRLTGEGSDLALTIKNVRKFTETLNGSDIKGMLNDAKDFTGTIKREPWRLIWPSTKVYAGDEKEEKKTDPTEAKPAAPPKKVKRS
jgi:ABC-type transporter Mla subunit MlaD